MTLSLPLLLDQTEPWWSDALCAQLGPGMADEWFPREGHAGHAAKKVCGRCPVQTQCLTYAVENGIREGVWGGTGERDRRCMIAAHNRAVA